MVVAVTRVTVVVAAVVLIVVHRVSLMATALRVLMATLLPVLMRIHVPTRIHAPKRRHALTSRQVLTLVAQTNPHAHPMVATTVATTMIAHHALVATLGILATAAATLAVVKIVVHRLLIVAVRTRASALRALIQGHVRTKAAKSVVHSAVIADTLALLPVMVIAMIAQRVLSATVIHGRSLIAHLAPILIVEIVSNALLALLPHAANTPRARVLSVPSHSSVLSVRNTRHVPRVRSSMRLVHRVTRSVLQVPLQRLQPMVATALHVALPSRLNTLQP